MWLVVLIDWIYIDIYLYILYRNIYYYLSLSIYIYIYIHFYLVSLFWCLIWVGQVSCNFTVTANFIRIMIYVYDANHASHFPNSQAKHWKFIFIISVKPLGNTRKKATLRRFRKFSLITCHLSSVSWHKACMYR